MDRQEVSGEFSWHFLYWWALACFPAPRLRHKIEDAITVTGIGIEIIATETVSTGAMKAAVDATAMTIGIGIVTAMIDTAAGPTVTMAEVLTVTMGTTVAVVTETAVITFIRLPRIRVIRMDFTRVPAMLNAGKATILSDPTSTKTATRVTTTDNPCKRIGRDFCRAISRDFSNTAATTTGGITPDAGHGNLR
jgi:hypothetical protein